MKVNGKLLKGTLLLTLFGFVGKALGALFRIGLVNIVGTSGMGIYGLIFPLFVFFTLLSSEGFSLGLTMNIARHKLDGKARAYKKEAFISIISLSVLSSLVLIFSSRFIATIQGGEVNAFLYMEIAVCVIVVSVLGYFKAIIRGEEAFKLFSLVEVIEDISKIVFALIFAYILMPYGVNASIGGVFAGIILSSVVSILSILLFGKKYIVSPPGPPLSKEERKAYFKFSSQTTLSELVVPFVQFIDSVLVIALLGSIGLSSAQSTSLFGLSRGSVSAILNLPTFLLAAFEFLLLPVLTRTNEEGYCKKTTMSLVLSFFVSLPFFIFFNLFSTELITLLYRGALTEAEVVVASSLLKIGSISIIFSAFAEVMIVGLEAKEISSVPLVSSIIAGVLKIIFMLIFVPKLSIYAVELSGVLFCMVECLVVFIYARRKKLFSRPKRLWLIMVLWLVLLGVAKLIIVLFKKFLSPTFAFILGGVLTIIIAILVGILIWRINKKKDKKVLDEIINFD